VTNVFAERSKNERRRSPQRPESQLDILQQSWHVGHVHPHHLHRSLHAALSSIPVCSCRVDANECHTQYGMSFNIYIYISIFIFICTFIHNSVQKTKRVKKEEKISVLTIPNTYTSTYIQHDFRSFSMQQN